LGWPIQAPRTAATCAAPPLAGALGARSHGEQAAEE